MALVNHAKREINAKIVFFGPVEAGKNANLNYIFNNLKPENRSRMKFKDVEKDRMLFFDFMTTARLSTEGFNVRFHI